MKLEILYETNELVVLNKPSGLLSIPERYDASQPSLAEYLKRKYPGIFVVHRLDKLTSGVIMFAKNAEAHRYFSMAFENREIHKEYTGIVLGRMTEESGTIDAPIGENKYRRGEMMVSKKGKPAITHFEVIESFSMFSVVRFKPVTGRTHQIRVHAQYIHHPLAADPLYGNGKPVFLSSFKKSFHLGRDDEEERPLLKRLALHASAISFKNEKGEDVIVEAPLPKDMKALIQQLRKNG